MPNRSQRPASPFAARLAAPAPGGSAPATGGALADGQEAEPPDTGQEGTGAGAEREAGAEAGQEAGPSRGNGTAFAGSAGGARPAVAACPNPARSPPTGSATAPTIRTPAPGRRRPSDRIRRRPGASR